MNKILTLSGVVTNFDNDAEERYYNAFYIGEKKIEIPVEFCANVNLFRSLIHIFSYHQISD